MRHVQISENTARFAYLGAGTQRSQPVQVEVLERAEIFHPGGAYPPQLRRFPPSTAGYSVWCPNFIQLHSGPVVRRTRRRPDVRQNQSISAGI